MIDSIRDLQVNKSIAERISTSVGTQPTAIRQIRIDKKVKLFVFTHHCGDYALSKFAISGRKSSHPI